MCEVEAQSQFCLTQTQTQTQTLTSSPNLVNPEIRTPWGRLFACYIFLDTVDLVDPVIKVGRSEECDIVIVRSRFPQNRCASISKVHFVISKEPGSPVFINDLSKNGTFLNGNLIGRNKRNILQNDDVISIGHKNLQVYKFFKIMGTDAEIENYLPHTLRKKYEVSYVLGQGACGEVRLVFDKVSCKPYAVKKIVKANYVCSNHPCLNDPKRIATEVEILKKLSHPCVIGMKEIVETDKEVFIVLDYMPGGELTGRILSIQKMTESQVKFIFYQIVLAVQYLHVNNVIHRDIKAQNILLSSDSSDDVLVKVTDFGLSKVIHNDTVMQTVCGTPLYVAPEILDGHYKEYSKQVDIWSLGVILYYMLATELPFSATDRKQLTVKIINGDYRLNNPCWGRFSVEVQDLIKRMLTVNPRKRITIDQILLHPWIAKDGQMQYRVQKLLHNNSSFSDESLDGWISPKRQRLG